MPDKPGHILEIPDSLGRDVDKAREGKIAPPPMEAFLSDTALREIEQATRARDEPVHAENLHPISRAQASTRTAFDGKSLPRAPSSRRVIPAPFQRPRIEAGKHGKSWQHVRADQVTCGDIVPEVGLVTEVYEHVIRKTRAELLDSELPPFQDHSGRDLIAVGTVIVLTGKGGQVKAFRPLSQVQVFR